MSAIREYSVKQKFQHKNMRAYYFSQGDDNSVIHIEKKRTWEIAEKILNCWGIFVDEV